ANSSIRTSEYAHWWRRARLSRSRSRRVDLAKSNRCDRPRDVTHSRVEWPVTAPTLFWVGRDIGDGQPGRPRRVWFRLVPSRENASHHVLVDVNTEGQRDLLRDPWTSPDSLFHVDDRGDDVRLVPWARLRRRFGREQPAILPLYQRSMKAQ